MRVPHESLSRTIRAGARIGRRRLFRGLQEEFAASAPPFACEPIAASAIPPFEAAKDERVPLRFDRDRAWIRWMVECPWVRSRSPPETTAKFGPTTIRHD